jgi:hypothetical protein
MCSSAAGRVRKFRLLSEDGMQNGLFYTLDDGIQKPPLKFK